MSFFKVLLQPFGYLYGLITALRNHLYSIGYSRSFQFETVVISVGNLSVGGTGKTPMIEYLIDLLKDYSITTLSRGYRRRTSGFRLANENDTALSIGDEPYQFYTKFKERVGVAVGEDRSRAIPQILFERPSTQIILLDDAYQHRSVKPNLNILLTEFDKPFYDDYMLPAGRLREWRKNADRADIVVISKCPKNIRDRDRLEMSKKVREYAGENKPVYYSSIVYDHAKPVFGAYLQPDPDILVFSGLARAGLFEDYLKSKYKISEHIVYPDHYEYTEKDILRIISRFNSIDSKLKSIITTEKDMVKLTRPEFEELFDGIPLFFVPIKTTFSNDGELFDELILNEVSKSI